MRISLFWRTFLLLAALIVASLVTVLAAIGLLERAPPEQRLAWEVASVVNLTRSALVSSEPGRRLALLDELAREEGVEVLPKEDHDRIVAPAPGARLAALELPLRQALGAQTRVAARVNDREALWVSFTIDGDEYWLALPRERLERQFGPGTATIAAIASVLSLAGALVLSRLVNRPLDRLARAIDAVSRGDAHVPLPEDGPTEIAALNRRFNRMAEDLAAVDEDRTIALAGISHDIRSPLARLRMEIELAPLEPSQRDAMADDIGRIDRIVGQFIQYARIAEPPRAERVDARAKLAEVESAYRGQAAAGGLALEVSVEGEPEWFGDPTDLVRACGNLIDNAMRYGRPAPDRAAEVRVSLGRRGDGIELVVADRGRGIPDADLDRLLRPFARLDAERSERGGSGLGLAIVARIARRYRGRLRLANLPGGGLGATLFLADYRAPAAAGGIASPAPRA